MPVIGIRVQACKRPVYLVSMMIKVEAKSDPEDIRGARRDRDMWVPAPTTRRVLRLRMEERPPIWWVAANILNKQQRTADKGWSSSLDVGGGGGDKSTP
jgi:hypothetical protein